MERLTVAQLSFERTSILPDGWVDASKQASQARPFALSMLPDAIRTDVVEDATPELPPSAIHHARISKTWFHIMVAVVGCTVPGERIRGRRDIRGGVSDVWDVEGTEVRDSLPHSRIKVRVDERERRRLHVENSSLQMLNCDRAGGVLYLSSVVASGGHLPLTCNRGHRHRRSIA